MRSIQELRRSSCGNSAQWLCGVLVDARIAHMSSHPHRARGIRTVMWLTVLAGLLCGRAVLPAWADETAKNVLVLYSFTDQSIFGPVDLLESSVRARVPGPVNFYVESFVYPRFDVKGYEQTIVESLKNAYSGRK